MDLHGPQQCEIPNSYDDDFNDGSLSHELPTCDNVTLQLIFYYVNSNLDNPLANKIHKLRFFYYQLTNINAKYRSKLKYMHLLAICNTSLLKNHGINAILTSTVDHLRILGNGYPFQVFGGVMHNRGDLWAMLADTPTSQLSGGSKESVWGWGAFRKCRFCMATFESMQECFITGVYLKA